ncbi:hypothetical protein [Mycolicibacterium elephantis]
MKALQRLIKAPSVEATLFVESTNRAFEPQFVNIALGLPAWLSEAGALCSALLGKPNRHLTHSSLALLC